MARSTEWLSVTFEAGPMASHCHPADRRVGWWLVAHGEVRDAYYCDDGRLVPYTLVARRSWGPYATFERAERRLADITVAPPDAYDLVGVL